MIIDGVGDLLSTIARCCRPVPPEAIAGYITLGRGVSIHRADCANLLRLRDAQPRARAGRGLGPAIAGAHVPGRRSGSTPSTGAAWCATFPRVLADEHISIEAMNTVTNPAENTATVDVTVTVHGLDELSRLLAPLRRRAERDQRAAPSLSAAPRIRRPLAAAYLFGMSIARLSARERRLVQRLAQRRVRVHRALQVLGAGRVLQREHGLGDQLAGHRAR